MKLRQDGQESPGKPKKSKERPGCHESPDKARKNLERPGKVRESQETRKAWNGGMNEPVRPTEGSVSMRGVSRGQERTDYLSPRKVNTCQEWKKPE